MIRYIVYILVIAALTFVVLQNGPTRHPAITSANIGLMSAGVFLIGESIGKMPCGPPNLKYYQN